MTKQEILEIVEEYVSENTISGKIRKFFSRRWRIRPDPERKSSFYLESEFCFFPFFWNKKSYIGAENIEKAIVKAKGIIVMLEEERARKKEKPTIIKL